MKDSDELSKLLSYAIAGEIAGGLIFLGIFLVLYFYW